MLKGQLPGLMYHRVYFSIRRPDAYLDVQVLGAERTKDEGLAGAAAVVVTRRPERDGGGELVIVAGDTHTHTHARTHTRTHTHTHTHTHTYIHTHTHTTENNNVVAV